MGKCYCQMIDRINVICFKGVVYKLCTVRQQKRREVQFPHTKVEVWGTLYPQNLSLCHKHADTVLVDVYLVFWLTYPCNSSVWIRLVSCVNLRLKISAAIVHNDTALVASSANCYDIPLGISLRC